MKITAALFSQILFLLVISSCSIQEVKDVLPSVLLPKASVNELLLDSARIYMYSSYNNSATVDSLISQIDSTTLTKREKGIYYLTKGYYLQKNGDTKNAIEYLKSAATIIFKSGLKRDKAETNLIWGELFEMTGLITEAKESYFDALEFYKDRPDSKQYFHTVMGLAATIPNDTIFLKKADNYLQEYPDIFLEQLYTYRKAYLCDNKNKKYELFKNYFSKYKQLLAEKELINIYSILATSSSMAGIDSASYYINKANQIVNNSNIPGSGLIHHYLMKAYIYVINKEYTKALSVLDSTLVFAKEQPGMLSQVYAGLHNVYKVQGNIAKANSNMNMYLKQEKKQLDKEHEIQTALLTIKYQLYENEMHITKIKNRWLYVVIILLLALILLIVVFVKNRRKVYKENSELQKLNSITINEKEELLKNFETIKDAIINNSFNSNNSFTFEDFRIGFIVRYPEFIGKVKTEHTKLSTIDIQYCILFSCELKNREISEMRKVSPEAVKKAKKRLNKALPLNGDTTIYDYLQQFKF